MKVGGIKKGGDGGLEDGGDIDIVDLHRPFPPPQLRILKPSTHVQYELRSQWLGSSKSRARVSVNYNPPDMTVFLPTSAGGLGVPLWGLGL